MDLAQAWLQTRRHNFTQTEVLGKAHPGKYLDTITIVLVILWYSSSILAITTSKMTMQAAPVPLVLCSAQFAIAAIISGAVLTLGETGTKMSNGQEGSMLAGISITYTLGVFFTNFVFSLAHASFVETVKSSEPISTVVLAYIMLGELETTTVYAALIPLVVGVGMASTGEAGGTIAAFCATMGSNFGFSARAVLAKQLKHEHPSSPSASSDVSLFFHISWIGLIPLLPLAIFSEGATLKQALASSDFNGVRFLCVLVFNGVMYTAYNQFSFMVLSRVTTATHAVLNVCRRVSVISFTTMVFGTPLNAINAVGIVIAVIGMSIFTYAKSAKKRSS